ncbi:MAG: allophycocyanin [Cyanobacteria bacterium P01_H01_bin.15]
MLTQLNRLSIDADGRYATDAELSFLEKYVEGIDERISGYEKIRDTEEELMTQVETEKRELDPNVFLINGRDVSLSCRQDFRTVLRWCAYVMLMGDLEHYRTSFLLWQRTIVKASGCTKQAEVTYSSLQKALKSLLSPTELKLTLPAVQLSQALLGD